MTFTYNGPGTTPRDTVRFYTADNVETEYFLEDGDIDFILTEWENKGTLYMAASAAAEAIANKLTREIDVSADGQNLNLGQLRDRYLDMSVKLREQHEDALVGGASLYAGGMDANESPDPSVAPLSFGTGMHDSPEAGQQDYGDADWGASALRRAQWGEEVP